MSSIIFAIGVAILMSYSLLKVLKQKNSTDKSMQTLKSSVEYIDPWEQQKEMLSTEKIKQMKNEWEINNKKNKFAAETSKVGILSEENEEIDDVLEVFKEICAGEVQRNEKEQFNLRKDEASHRATAEEANWWL